MLSSDENENKPIGKVSQRKAKNANISANTGANTSGKTTAKPEGAKKAEAGKKAEPRKRKEDQRPAPKPDQLLEALQRLGAQTDEVIAPVAEPVAITPVAEPVASAPVMSIESSASETALPEAVPAEAAPVAAAEPAKATPVSLQTIADAYGDYSKKSLEQTSSFVAELAGARSLNRAFELQTAFARQAYETFVEQSRRIRELHRELAKQRLTKLEGFVGMTKGR